MNVREDVTVTTDYKLPTEQIIQMISQRISEKSYAIESLQNDLDNYGFTEDEIKIINDIISDEKDHLILLTAMLQDRVGHEDVPAELDDISESVIVRESTPSDEAIKWIESNLGLKDCVQDKDGSYLYSLSNSKEFGKIYSKLDKNSGVTELKSSSMVTDDYSSIYFRRDSEPRFMINLQADFIANDYSLIVVEE